MNARMDADKRLLCIYNTYNIFSLFTYPSIHEYKIHLAKGKYHLQNRVNASEHLIAWRVPRNLEKRSKLQPIVDHCTQSKCCKNEFHMNKLKRINKLSHFYFRNSPILSPFLIIFSTYWFHRCEGKSFHG